MNVKVVEVPGHNLRVLRLDVSVYNVYITNQFQTTFARVGGGGKSVGRGDCEYQEEKETLKTLDLISILGIHTPGIRLSP